jgi:enoyl-CoA hydratase
LAEPQSIESGPRGVEGHPEAVAAEPHGIPAEPDDSAAAEDPAAPDVALTVGRYIRVEVPATRPGATPGGTVVADGVALVTLDRPDALNALSFEVLDELASALERLDRDPTVRCIVLAASSERAFAAGADIKELAGQTPDSLRESGGFDAWGRIDRIGVPIVAAVRGVALGGGCELAMACDMIVAGDDATFGQPEIRIGVMPGAGGTQRLTRAAGKARAMEIVLTGRQMGAREAERLGLVTRVVPADATLGEAIELAARVAAGPPLAIREAKRAVLQAAELPLAEGIALERQAFFDLFATEDQSEGMDAFVAKRPPRWQGR